MTSSPHALLSRDAIEHNFNHLKRISYGAKVMCAVKGNAYGHGITEIVNSLENTDGFVVARLSEARLLRKMKVKLPITLLGGFIDVGELAQAIDLQCDIVIYNLKQIDILESFTEKKLTASFWLKIETGMNRLGILSKDASSSISRITSIAWVHKLGLMTHLSDAEDKFNVKNSTQLENFRKITDNFSGDISFANSAVIANYHHIMKDFDWNNRGEIWVRPGIALYGISPLRDVSAEHLKLKPVMNFISKLIAVKAISRGETVGYNSTWTADQDTFLGIISAGYGDGYSKSLNSGTPVIINKRRVPLVGLVSMDLISVDLGPKPKDKIGDEVLLWGEGLTIEEVADYSNLTTYSLATGISARVRRII
ncbi:MAG: alanine racemase [Woeseiaceae bacterium]|nr:alanine racemase [Woeseiaceae bacterium]MDG1866075.1 alanine racemase [Woeseiaceae bacterium]